MNRIPIVLLIVLICSCSDNRPLRIGIQPYGNVEAVVIDSMTNILERTYDAQVISLEQEQLPHSAFVTIKSPRYRADSLMLDLLANRPETIDHVIGITASDISTTKRDSKGQIMEPASTYSDWGVFGLGFMPGRSCIVSTFRLKHVDRELYLDRIQKVAIHEIGHNLGLEHCADEECVMQDAVESIRTVDRCKANLCSRCRKRIK